MIYLGLFLLSLLLTYMMRIIATKRSLIAIPNDRSSHTVPTPHGGGIAIAITWFIGMGFLYIQDQLSQELFFALLSGLLIALVSFIDDIYDLPPKIRLLAQVATALTGLYFLGGLHRIDLGVIVIDNHYLASLIAVLATVWFINLYNFLDGIDGYAGSEAVFLGLSGFILFHDPIFIILVVSVSGFLVLNWHKAKIFMGDVGSTLLGYNVAIFAIYFQNNGSSLLIWLILFGVFWFDATLTLVRRFRNKESLSQAHKKHAYQRAVQSGWRHDKVVLLAMMLNGILLALAYWASLETNKIVIATISAVTLLYLAVRFVDKKKGFE